MHGPRAYMSPLAPGVTTKPTDARATPPRRQYSQHTSVIHAPPSPACATRGYASRQGYSADGATITPRPSIHNLPDDSAGGSVTVWSPKSDV